MAEVVTKKAPIGKSAVEPDEDRPQKPLADMPTPVIKVPARKTERLFVAWTGDTIGSGGHPTDEVVIRDLRIFGIKAECTEFAVDQEPAWKWVETAKGQSVAQAILEKIAAR